MEWIKIIFKALIIVVLQVVLFDRLQIQGWGYPMIYTLLLLSLPIQVPRWAEMLIGLLVGLIIDICNSSMGVHMAACIAMSYLRPILLKKSVQDIERIKGEITIHSIGVVEYIKCAVILIFIHHLMVFALEAWSLQNWWMLLLQIVFSSILTSFIVIGYGLLKE